MSSVHAPRTLLPDSPPSTGMTVASRDRLRDSAAPESGSNLEIKNLTSDAEQIGLAEPGVRAPQMGSWLSPMVRSTQAALPLSDAVSGAAILKTRRAVLEYSPPAMMGNWRKEQVGTGGASLGPHTAHGVAPRHHPDHR
jgi:hypothetical protein